MASANTTTVSFRVPNEWFPYLKTLPMAEMCQDALLEALLKHCGKNAKLRERFAEGRSRMQHNRRKYKGVYIKIQAQALAQAMGKENRMRSKPHPARSN